MSHEGNKHQNHNEMSPPTCQNGYYPKNKKQLSVRMWESPLGVTRTGAATVGNSTEAQHRIRAGAYRMIQQSHF